MSKVALVTGGTTGLGAAVCQLLAGDGHQVIANYLPSTEAQARKWQAQVSNACAIEPGDVSDEASCLTMVEKLIAEYGRIDILINNAGIVRDSTIAKMSSEQWHAVLNTNLNSLYNMSKPVVESMQQHRYGRIVNMSSVNAQRGQFGQTNYCAAKAGVHGFTKALAQETARHGITVNTVSPGLIQTSMVETIPQDMLDKVIETIPVGRVGQPDDIAHTIRFLIDEDTSYITGADIPVNGGLFMH